MKAFGDDLLIAHSRIDAINSDLVNKGDAGSRFVASFWPVAKLQKDKESSSPDRSAFKQAFIATLEKRIEGALSPYLFYDPPDFENKDVNYKSAWGSRDNIPYGAPSWDAHIAESTLENPEHKKQNEYGFAEGDEEVIRTALQKDLLDKLPRRMTYYSYGPGELIAVRKKDFQLIDAIMNTNKHSIETLNAVDINYRYARSFANEANQRYNRATLAIQGDFMEGTLNLGSKVGTSVIGIFGGPFANAPSIKGQFNAKQKAAQYLAQLVDQHGEGTRVINTFDTQSDEKILMADYKPTKRFEAFILGAFPRAVNEGIITTPNYDVFKNWKLTREFNQEERAIKLIATAKKDHIIDTEDKKSYHIKKDEKLVVTLSHKWSEADWREIYKAAGLDDINVYGDGSRKLIIARAANEPDLSLVK